jgi:hypothetical protein
LADAAAVMWLSNHRADELAKETDKMVDEGVELSDRE